MNKRCVAMSMEQYKESIKLLREGFMLDGVCVRPNPRIAAIEVLQASLGLRLGDTLQLRMSSFIKDGDRWRLDIYEQKTKKYRHFTVPIEVYSFIQDYAYTFNIGKEAKLFDISERQVERHLNKVFTKMNLPLRNFGSHSYRKFFATQVYKASGFDMGLVQKLLQHSSISVTKAYISFEDNRVESVLNQMAENIV